MHPGLVVRSGRSEDAGLLAVLATQVKAAESEARRRSNGVLWLMVNAKNDGAIAFYAHQGYTKVGTSYFSLGEGRYENHVLVGADETL